MASRRSKTTRVRKKRTTDALLAVSRIALEATAQGVCVYDADNRVVLFNRQYVDLFNLSANVIRPGISYREVLKHSAECGRACRTDGTRAARAAEGRRADQHPAGHAERLSHDA
jgi:PAS domain-containing protein